MFLFKKIVGPLFFPFSLSLGLLLAGLALLWGRRRPRAGKVLVSLGTGLLIVVSLQPVADLLLRPLEWKYPPLADAKTLAGGPGAVRWVVVLDGDEGAALARVVEGIRLYRQLPGSKLLLSGGSVYGGEAGAVSSARVARNLGVDAKDLVLEAVSRDTEEEAREIKKVVGPERFILVTSASHMPRSVALFKKAGLNPIPAPAGYLVKRKFQLSPGAFFPNGQGLQHSETAVYEYLGLGWAWLRGAV